MLRRLSTALALALGLAGCAVPTDRVIEDIAGRPDTRRTINGERVGPAPPSRAAARAFVEVVERVEPVAERLCRARNPRANCDFRIVVDDRPGLPPNAFQTLDRNGRPIIAFTLPLIGEVRSPDEAAFILAHEAGHHVAGHLERQAINAELGATVFGQIAGRVGGATAESIRAAQELGAAVGARSYSREFELEADVLGTIIAFEAGYDPLVGAEFFSRIPDPGNRFLGTHPPNSERLAVVQRTAAGLRSGAWGG